MKTTLDYTNDIRTQKVKDILSGQFLEKYPEIIDFSVYFSLSSMRGGYNVNVFMNVDYYDFYEDNTDNRRKYRLIKKDIYNLLNYILGEKEFVNAIDFNPIKQE
jgi:hypothetical protein